MEKNITFEVKGEWSKFSCNGIIDPERQLSDDHEPREREIPFTCKLLEGDLKVKEDCLRHPYHDDLEHKMGVSGMHMEAYDFAVDATEKKGRAFVEIEEFEINMDIDYDVFKDDSGVVDEDLLQASITDDIEIFIDREDVRYPEEFKVFK